MALNVELVSQFAKYTANKKETKKESTAWGEVVEITESGKTFVKLDGSDRVTPVETVTEAKVGDRVSVTIKNHAATLTGNTSSPSINADGSTIITIRNDFKNLSADNLLIRGELTASKGNIAELTAKNVKIEETLTAHAGEFETLKANIADINILNATFATIDSLNAKEAEIRNLFADYATVEELAATNAKITSLEAEDAAIRNLFADYAKITDLEAGYATIGSLEAVDAKVSNLNADVGNIDTLVSKFISGESVHSQFANSVVALIGDAQIKSAMIQDISASKITSGEIITDKVKIESEDGSLIISGPVLQIGDGARTRIQIGKDASGAYSFSIFDANGNALFYEDGITGNAIPDQIINNDMIKDDAAIDANKLDIDKLFEVINEDGSHTLKSTKVKLDEEGQTLDVAFGALTTKVDGIQIGGINLLKKTRSFDGVGGASSIIEDTYRDLKVRYLDCTDMASGYPLFRDMAQWAEAIPAEGGAQYTLSFYAKGTKVRAHFFNGAFGVVRAESSQGIVKTSSVNDGNMDFTLTDEWQRYWVTYTVEDTNTQNTNGKKYVLLRVIGLEEAYACGVKFEKGNKATDWSPAPEDAETEINSLNSQYHSLSVTIDSLSSTIGQQSQEIAKKADGSTVETLSSQYSTLNQTVNGLSNTVGEHTTQISKKADGSTVTDVTNRMTTLESNLDGFKSTVSETYTTKTDFNNLSDDFNNLSIGGRNLLINTGNTTGTIKMCNSSSTQTNGVSGFTNSNGVRTWNCYVQAVPVGTSNPPEIYYRFMPTTSDGLRDLEAGETYIFSGKVKLSTTSGTLTRLTVRTQGFVSSWTGGINNNILTEDSDEWVEFSEKFTVQNNATNYYVSLQLYYEVGTEYSGVIQIKEFKIEKGNKKTEWTPAPEDAETRMIAAETAINQTKSDITLYAKKTEVTETLSGYYTAAQTDSKISVASNSITLSVSSTYATKTALNGVSDDLTGLTDDFNNLSIGGRNLIAGTSKDEMALGGYPASSYSEGKTGKTIDIPNGDEYVLSFEAKSTANGDKIRCHFYSPNTTTHVESSTGWVSTSSDGLAAVTLTTAWKRYWVKYTQNGAETTTVKNWIVGRRMAGEGTGSISVRAIKLEAGNKATEWTPAPEDTKTEFATVRSEIKQLADSITLSVTGGLGSTASIKLSANGATTTQTIDMSKVRSAFANDTTAITISAGKVTFNSGTIVINAGNFTLDASGNITASNAVLNGTVTTTSGTAEAKLTSGSLALYRDGDIYGAISSKYHSDSAANGLTLTVRQSGSSGLMFVAAAGDAMFGTSYMIYYQMQPANEGDVQYCYEIDTLAVHTFNDSVRFMGITQHIYPSFFAQSIYLANASAIGWLDGSGEGPWQLITFTSGNVLTIGASDGSYTTSITGTLTLENNKWLHIKNKGGTAINIMGIDTSNHLFIGNGLKNNGSSNVHIYSGRSMYLYNDTDRIEFVYTTTSPYSAYFRPGSNGTCTLGTESNRWYCLYAKYSCNISSDRRLKENIVSLSDMHSELFDKLQPVQYNFIEGNGRTHYGLIAQDVVAAMEEMGMQENDLDLVSHSFYVDEETGELNDSYGMAYTNLIPMLIHEVQKLKHEIKTLKGE